MNFVICALLEDEGTPTGEILLNMEAVNSIVLLTSACAVTMNNQVSWLLLKEEYLRLKTITGAHQ